MCGIVGLIDPDGFMPSVLEENCDLLHHRGPDDAGIWTNSKCTVGLGHRRLAILDLSSTAHQPMHTPCGRYIIVFNGEIYNYLELRDELEAAGRLFAGSGDTEVVLAAYLEWGECCLQRFNGMFALAIFDIGNNDAPASLFLARDRAGKKPLYYSHKGRQLAFASELKAIPNANRGGIDLSALNYYLALGYVPGSMCILDGVAKLPAAHSARFFPDSGVLDVRCWWSLPPYTPDLVENNIESLVDETEDLLRDAVALRMRSDVPVGVLLSGGLDSSLIVACAANNSSQPVQTFTMGIPGASIDETRYAEVVARHFSTDHHLIEVPRPSLSILNEFSRFIDEPIADSSLIPTYLVSMLTSNHVKVALGGDGGDELFGGYQDYSTALVDMRRFGWIPNWAYYALATVVAKLPPGIPGRNRLHALRGGPLQSLVWGSPYFDAPARKMLFSEDVIGELNDEFLSPEHYQLALFETGVEPVDSMTRTHFGSILPDDFLVKVDRASMAASLEMRCPFLDVRLVEFAFSKIPSQWKVCGGESRRLQKKLGRRLLPKALDIDRKQGFSIPMDEWLRGSDKSWSEGLLVNLLPDVIQTSAIRDLIAGHMRGRANGARLYSLIMLSLALQNLSLGGS